MTKQRLILTTLFAIAGLAFAADLGFAQSGAITDTPHPAGPIESYSAIEHSQGVAPDGTEIDSIRSIEMGRAYSDGNGELSARTHVEETGGVHAVAPPVALSPPPPPVSTGPNSKPVP